MEPAGINFRPHIRCELGAYAGPVNPTPSSGRIDVIIHNADAEWWQIIAAIGPIVVILGAVLIWAIGWLTLRRRTVADTVAFDLETKADSQSDWWPRARWALEASLDDDPARREVGFVALQLLNESSLSGREESLMIAEAWKSPLRDARTISPAGEKKSVKAIHRAVPAPRNSA
jgi:hypothetical protein